MSLMFEQTLTNAPRFEKLKFWMRTQEPPRSFAAEAPSLDITGATLARNCAKATMPVHQHAHLTKKRGFPAELLPVPENRKSGPKPRRLPEPAQAV